jgi:hypothetical protein
VLGPPWVPRSLVAAADWNATVTRRLGELLKVARERTRRKHCRHARVEVLGYVCEAQQRGAFHPHVVLGLQNRFGPRRVGHMPQSSEA